MSLEVLFPLLIVVVAAYFTLYRASWGVIGSSDGKPEPEPDVASLDTPQQAPPSIGGDAQFAPSVKFVPADGFIDKDRLALIARAEARMEGHIALDRIQTRPGWLLFDPAQIVGEPPVVLRFDGTTASGEPLEVQLFPLEQIRELERKNTYLAQCRRASIAARWADRKDARRRQAQPAAVTPQVRNANAG